MTRLLIDVYDEIQRTYENRKRQAGQLDFDDLQIKVRDLLQQEESIRGQLAQRYPYIMVDEYQDTDHLQYEILKPLVSAFKSGNLLIVGDQNQSIYRFRGADVRVFNKTRDDITDYQSALTSGFTWEEETLDASNSEKCGELRLPENFRLLRNLVGFINLIFEEIMGGRNEFEVEYEPLIQGRATDSLGDVELLIGSKEGNLRPSVDEYELIGARIRHLIGQVKRSGRTTAKAKRSGRFDIVTLPSLFAAGHAYQRLKLPCSKRRFHTKLQAVSDFISVKKFTTSVTICNSLTIPTTMCRSQGFFVHLSSVFQM